LIRATVIAAILLGAQVGAPADAGSHPIMTRVGHGLSHGLHRLGRGLHNLGHRVAHHGHGRHHHPR
jgi:hypothetical protein